MKALEYFLFNSMAKTGKKKIKVQPQSVDFMTMTNCTSHRYSD